MTAEVRSLSTMARNCISLRDHGKAYQIYTVSTKHIPRSANLMYI